MKIGIDLGTTFSLCAFITDEGKVELIPDSELPNEYFTPSAIIFKNEGAYIGHLAEALQYHDPNSNVIRFFKRHFGDSKPVSYDTKGRPWYPEGLAALMLSKLKHDAEEYTGEIVTGAVITVPAHFNDPQRRAVIEAAALVNIEVVALLEEPVAAALHHGILGDGSEHLSLVFDFGGGTFDISIVSTSETGLFVIAKDGDSLLGGKEFDELIAEHILNALEIKNGKQIELDARMSLQIRKMSEEMKIELGMPGQDFLRKRGIIGGFPIDVEISRSDFENLSKDLVDHILMILNRCLKSAGLIGDDLDSVLLVGGSSLIPHLRLQILRSLAIDDKSVNYHEPMKSVALGAALHLAQSGEYNLAYNIPPILKGVTGHNIALKVVDSKNKNVKIDTVIKKNVPLPASVSKTYYTTHKNQKYLRFEIVQYTTDPKDHVSIGSGVIGPFVSPVLNYPIETQIECLENGTVRLMAFDRRTGAEITKTFDSSEDRIGMLAVQKTQIVDTTIRYQF